MKKLQVEESLKKTERALLPEENASCISGRGSLHGGSYNYPSMVPKGKLSESQILSRTEICGIQRLHYLWERRTLRDQADLEKRRDAEIERKEYLERRQEVLRPLVAVLNKPELTRDVLMAVVDRIYWYDGALEVMVKGEEYLGGEEP